MAVLINLFDVFLDALIRYGYFGKATLFSMTPPLRGKKNAFSESGDLER